VIGSEYVKLTLDKNIAVITIDNPPMNPLSDGVLAGLKEALDTLDKVEDVRALVITGAGEKSFVAGADIKEFTAWTAESAVDLTARGQRLFQRIENFPAPVIAAINGYALGGGLELALCADIRVVSKSAKMGLPEVGLGIIPGYGGTQRLIRAINIGQAKKLIYTGACVSAEKALELGLVQDVVEPDLLMDFVLELATGIAKNAPIAVRCAKSAINAISNSEMPFGLSVELQASATVFSSKDRVEGVNAFIEKRKPVFQNQ